MTEENIEKIEKVYKDWEEVEGFSKVISNEEAARNDYNLSPSRYVATDEKEEYLSIEEALVELEQIEEEREEANEELTDIIRKLGFEGYEG